MIKIHNCDERPSSLLKISPFEKFKKNERIGWRKENVLRLKMNYNDFLIPSHHFIKYMIKTIKAC
jgi:hypothetical protein